MAGEAPKPDERDKIARQAFSSAPGIKDIKITRSEPLRMGQSNGHEIIAEAKDSTSDIDVTAVQWLRFGQNAHLQMFAIVRRAMERGLSRNCARSATASSRASLV